MNSKKRDDLLGISLIIAMLLAVIYVCYVIGTATHKPGCVDSYQHCVSSHTETTQRYWGKRWHDEEYEVCDEWETITYDCDCVTYHWFWGDSKNR